MSLDTIKLSAFSRQLLFTNNLVDSKQKAEPNNLTNNTPVDFLGGNLRHILFLVHQTDALFIPDDQMKLLTNLITACGLTMDDIALVNCHQGRRNYLQLDHQFQATNILLFGVSTEELELPFTLPFFQIQRFGEKTYLTAPSLGELMDHVNLKAPLWACLQQLFLTK